MATLVEMVDGSSAAVVPIPVGRKQHWITSKPAVRAILGVIRLALVREAFSSGLGPTDAVRVLREMRRKLREYFGETPLQKLVRVDGRIYWTMEAPGWPSRSLRSMLRTEVRRHASANGRLRSQRIVFFGITKKCPLACEHCYDWHNHNGREVLSVDEIIRVIHGFQERGVSQIFLSGGEPLARFDDLITLLHAARPGTDFWILTSGYKLTAERAHSLREAGLIGVSVSLDHHEPHAHNRFRGREDSFEWVVKAVRHAHDAGLVVALSLCATKSFTTSANLDAYARLAKRLGAEFIQILEPRVVGRYAGSDVTLPAEQIELLSRFYERLNFGEDCAAWPVVSYHGYHQRTVGCSGAGDRFLYVDADGDVHACPFCHKKQGNVLQDPWDDTIAKLRTEGCAVFESSRI